MLCSHCLFPAVNNLWQAWWHYQTCYKAVLRSLIQSWYNKNVTRWTTQGCNNIVISRLYQICWNNLATSLIISTRLLQVVNSLFQICWQLGTSSANTTCWRLVGFYACIIKRIIISLLIEHHLLQTECLLKSTFTIKCTQLLLLYHPYQSILVQLTILVNVFKTWTVLHFLAFH